MKNMSPEDLNKNSALSKYRGEPQTERKTRSSFNGALPIPTTSKNIPNSQEISLERLVISLIFHVFRNVYNFISF